MKNILFFCKHVQQSPPGLSILMWVPSIASKTWEMQKYHKILAEFLLFLYHMVTKYNYFELFNYCGSCCFVQTYKISNTFQYFQIKYRRLNNTCCKGGKLVLLVNICWFSKIFKSSIELSVSDKLITASFGIQDERTISAFWQWNLIWQGVSNMMISWMTLQERVLNELYFHYVDEPNVSLFIVIRGSIKLYVVWENLYCYKNIIAKLQLFYFQFVY